jgi:hypothetical protein
MILDYDPQKFWRKPLPPTHDKCIAESILKRCVSFQQASTAAQTALHTGTQ